LWDVVEEAVGEWHDLGKPRRHHFGITIGPDGQFLTLAEHRWRL
jgi:protein-L-isoaspartate(D-aspartate) O-methyltransferase